MLLLVFKEIIKLGPTFHLSHKKVLCHLVPVHLHKDEMTSLAKGRQFCTSLSLLTRK